MSFKWKPVNISYSHVNVLVELCRAGDCFTLGYFGYCGEVSYCGWWWSTNGNISLISYCDDIGLVTEASTDKEIVDFIWDESSVTPELFFISGVSRTDVWEYIQILVDIIQYKKFGVGNNIFLCWICWGVCFLVGWRVFCERLHVWCICRSFVLVYQCGFWYIDGGWRCGIGSRFPIFHIHTPVWYTHGLTCDQVVHPLIDSEKKVEEQHVFAPIVSNVSTI